MNGDTDDCIVGVVSYTQDGVCDDGGPGSLYSHCPLGKDYTDCVDHRCPVLYSPSAPPIIECTVVDGDVDDCEEYGIRYNNNGLCDDGGIGSSFSVCAIGTDLTDCGVYRCPVSRRERKRRELSYGDVRDASRVEVWVSRTIGTFGTRAAYVNLNDVSSGEGISVRTTEGSNGESAYGRYVYLRSFESNIVLRVDSINAFRLAATVRNRKLDDGDDEDEKESGNVTAAGTVFQRIASLARLSVMRNLTRVMCDNYYLDPDRSASFEARVVRRTAGSFWAKMTEEESGRGCIDCITRRSMNCSHWFAFHHRIGRVETTHDERGESRRRLKQKMEETKDDRRRKLHDAFGQACCRTNRRTGEKKCDPSYCKEALRQSAQPRMAHVLRRMHENTGPTTLTVAQLVATDMLAPHLHPDERCRSVEQRKRTGEMECVAHSLLHHSSKKHKISMDDLNSKMEGYGVNIADMITSHLKSSASGSNSENDHSNIQEQMKRFKKRMEEHHPSPNKKRKKTSSIISPKPSWIQRAHAEVEEAKKVPASERRRRPRALQQEQQAEKKSTVLQFTVDGDGTSHQAGRRGEWTTNHSSAAKKILRSANLAAATTGADPLSVQSIVSAAVDSSIRSQYSLVGTLYKMSDGMNRISNGVSNIRSQMSSSAEHSRKMSENIERRRLSRQKSVTSIHKREHGRLLKHLDYKVANPRAGFALPEGHEDKHGWITDLMDWNYVYDELIRVGQVLRTREEWKATHAHRTGTQHSGPLMDHHRTGYEWLDFNSPRSLMGDMIRSLMPVKHPTKGRHLTADEQRDIRNMPRHAHDTKGKTPLLRVLMDAMHKGHHSPLSRLLEEAEYYDDVGHPIRRMTDLATYVGTSTVKNAAYYASNVFGSPSFVMPASTSSETNELEFFQQVGRYLVYDTALCYLYSPPSANGGPFGDGSAVTLHYGRKGCFPMITFMPDKMPTFNEYYGLGPEFRWSDLEYDNMCDSTFVKYVLNSNTEAMATSSWSIISGPFALTARVMEGVDSIRNLVQTGLSNSTENERAAAIVCGLSQLGGVIFGAIVTTLLVITCLFAPLLSICCYGCYRGVRSFCTKRVLQQRNYMDDAMRMLIKEQMEDEMKRMLMEAKRQEKKDEEESLTEKASTTISYEEETAVVSSSNRSVRTFSIPRNFL